MPYYAHVAEEISSPCVTFDEASKQMHLWMDECMSEGVESGNTLARVVYVAEGEEIYDREDTSRVLVEYLAVDDTERNEVALPKDVGDVWDGWARWDLQYHYLLMPAGKKAEHQKKDSNKLGEYISKDGLVLFLHSKIEEIRMQGWQTETAGSVLVSEGKIAVLEEVIASIEKDFGLPDMENDLADLESLRQRAEEYKLDHASDSVN